MSRRRFLFSSGIAITAFIPASRGWSSGGNPPHGSVPVPNLDGELFFSGEILQEAAADFGRTVSRIPLAVLQPGSIDDVRKMVRFARRQRINVGGMSMIGNTHTTFGQSQVEAGIVIDMSALDQIHEIAGEYAYVDAGVRWRQLLLQTAAQGTSPPTLTDHIDLSVGGVLSVSGIGGQTYRSGLMADNVLELEVVTGNGQLVTCSPHRQRRLFNALRCGLGQFGIIVRARVPLVPVPAWTRTYTALYNDIHLFTADQEFLVDEGRFDYVEGQAVAADGGGWNYLLEVVSYFEPGNEPDDEALLGDLSFLPGTVNTEDRTYYDFANRLEPIVAFLTDIGVWGLPHPWLDMFVPGSHAPDFIASVLADETLTSVGQGVILIYPFKRSRVKPPFFPLPDEETVYLFSLLRTTLPPTDPNEQISRNREIYEALNTIGGKRYTISSVPFDRDDWRDHFGSKWRSFVTAKHRFDPRNILTPGQGIFPA